MHQHLAVAAAKVKANGFAEDLRPVVQDIHEAGHTSVRATAAELNRRDIKTAQDRTWHPTSAGRRLQRLAAI